ncbi:pyridoxal-phosphate dependent enzyme [Mycolicibacterium sp.]|uniref:pyridoxal-phosphate dependent enzyme n=1 Tax=Mycolicibacterium sp. TaxID=2320850 RepID=UPI003D13C943
MPVNLDVTAAAQRIRAHVHRTPVMTSASLDHRLGGEVFFKCENLQKIGAFKARGAFNAVLQLDDEQRKRGVVAFSAGNHAQAVALAAGSVGVSSVILMPLDVPESKRQATIGYGAEVIHYDRYSDDREALVADIVARTGRVFISPYDDAAVVTGQGTAALELLQDTGELDAIYVPVGGGGLLAGAILAARTVNTTTQVHGVEPTGGDDASQSLRAGRIVSIPTPDTVADGAQSQHLGELPFAIISEGVRDIHTVDDTETVAAMRFLFSRMKLVVEPTGCLGLAALLADRNRVAGKRVGVILSGGNIDPLRFARLLVSEE